jgi:hypothetical protein
VQQIIAAGRLRDRSLWLMFSGAALIVAAGTWPVLALYLEAQRVHGFARPIGEILGYSADVYSYLTAAAALRALGPLLQAWPKPEGELFLGFVPAALALIGVVAAIRDARSDARDDQTRLTAVDRRRMGPRALLTLVLGIAAAALIVGLLGILFTGGFVTSVGGIPIRATNAPRLLFELALVGALAAIVSGTFRHAAARWMTSAAAVATLSLLMALWLSLGPVARSAGRTLEGMGLYGVFLDHVPGFAGLRVPARYAMIAAVYLSALAGIGAAWLMRPTMTRQTARVVVIALSLAFLVEATFAPMPVNQTWGDTSIAPPARLQPAPSAPAVYRQLAALPGELVVAEFPFGDPAWELRYVYYSTVHWKRLVNGYSGGFPQGYKVRVARFQRLADAPDEAWTALRQTGATHAVVHEDALAAGEARLIREWLESRGARESGRFGGDVLYDLRHAP